MVTNFNPLVVCKHNHKPCDYAKWECATSTDDNEPLDESIVFMVCARPFGSTCPDHPFTRETNYEIMEVDKCSSASIV